MWLLEERRALVGVAAGGFTALLLMVALLGEFDVALIHLVYAPVLAVGLLKGARAGLAAGGSATLVLVLAALVSPSLSPADYGASGILSSLVAFSVVGGATGAFADRQRRLIDEARNRALSEQSAGVMDARAFGAALDLRVNSGRAFALLLCALGDTPNGAHGELEVVIEGIALGRVIRRDDEVADLSNGEFAVLTWSSTSAEAGAACNRLERVLLDEDLAVVFGYAVCPYDGIDAVSIYRVAEKRRADRARTETNVDGRLEARFGSA